MSPSRRRRQLTSLRFTSNSSVTQSGRCLAVNILPVKALWDCLCWFLWSFPSYLVLFTIWSRPSSQCWSLLSYRTENVNVWHTADCQCSVFVHLWSLTTTKISPPTSMLLGVKLYFFHWERNHAVFFSQVFFYGGPESSTHCSLRKHMQRLKKRKRSHQINTNTENTTK